MWLAIACVLLNTTGCGKNYGITSNIAVMYFVWFYNNIKRVGTQELRREKLLSLNNRKNCIARKRNMSNAYNITQIVWDANVFMIIWIYKYFLWQREFFKSLPTYATLIKIQCKTFLFAEHKIKILLWRCIFLPHLFVKDMEHLSDVNIGISNNLCNVLT
jgi:hypothetical protein